MESLFLFSFFYHRDDYIKSHTWTIKHTVETFPVMNLLYQSPEIHIVEAESDHFDIEQDTRCPEKIWDVLRKAGKATPKE